MAYCWSISLLVLAVAWLVTVDHAGAARSLGQIPNNATNTHKRCRSCATRTLGTSRAVVRQVVPDASEVYKMELRREISSPGTCREDSTYGYYGSEIWVDQGCRGDFYVCYYEGFTQSVTCSSERMRRQTCNYRNTCNAARSVSMTRHHSNSPCVDGYSFEAGTASITVTKGCRATFNIGCFACI